MLYEQINETLRLFLVIVQFHLKLYNPVAFLPNVCYNPYRLNGFYAERSA